MNGDMNTLSRFTSRHAKSPWSVGAIGEEKFREPSLKQLSELGQLPSISQLLATLLAMLLLGTILVLDRVATPYVLVAPGTVESLRGRISFEGSDLPAISNEDGAISFVTVETSMASYVDHVYARVRSDLALLPIERVRAPGESEADERRRDELLMLSSQEIAEYVALKYLGIPVVFAGDGVLVEEVSTDSGAFGKIEISDVIRAVDGQRVLVASDIREILASRNVGEEVRIEVDRGGRSLEISVPLSASSDGEERPVIGVLVRTINPHVEAPFEVRFEVGNVGGPSAGLAFTLEIIDSLRPQGLVRNKKIVATGAVSAAGAVAPVGGIYQKAVAASRAGADYFLIPAANSREVGEFAGETRIIPVESVDSAVRFLEALKNQ